MKELLLDIKEYIEKNIFIDLESEVNWLWKKAYYGGFGQL